MSGRASSGGVSLSCAFAAILITCLTAFPPVLTIASAAPLTGGTVEAPSQSDGYRHDIYTVPADVESATITATGSWDDRWHSGIPTAQASQPFLVAVPFAGNYGCDFIYEHPENHYVGFDYDPYERDWSESISLTVGPGVTVAIAGHDCYVGDNFDFPMVVNWSVELKYADSEPQITGIDGGGAEGSGIPLDATVVDDGASPLTYAWSYTPGPGVDPGAACSFGPASNPEDANLTCTDDGVYDVTLTATDAVGSAEATASVTVTNGAPQIPSVSFLHRNVSCGTDNAFLAVEFGDPGSNDSHVADIDWGQGRSSGIDPATSPLQAQHTYPAGSHTATVLVTDDDGSKSAAAKASLTVAYDTDGIMRPIDAGGRTKIFKNGRTIPVKIQIRECDGSVASDLRPEISIKKVSGATPDGVAEPSIQSTSGADTGTTMRFDSDDGIYIYNLATDSLSDPTAEYKITVAIQPGQTASATIGLRK